MTIEPQVTSAETDLSTNTTPQATANESQTGKNSFLSRFSPTLKGAAIGAVAGSILPVFGTISGAIIGGIAGKVYEKKCAKHS
ncbi:MULTISPECIES: glycine zipper domain-containing protein [unclassified Acinetobacter]|uniref:glycine zipper domain-containing protein n=1 Tax=unclassified Acinetobacter TaxID=196816 RepID=UPI001C555DBF|nr:MULTISPECIES: glycine zipper domain-containing protein [unclassified Acinetobacter]